MRRWTLALTVALMALPGVVVAQQRGPGAYHGERNPVRRILLQRDSLELGADQVTRLTAIAERLDAETAPLLQRMSELRGEMPPRPEGRPSAEERERFRQKMEELRPVREQLRERHRAAIEEARGVLSEDQWDLVRPRVEARRGELGPRSRPDNRPGRRGGPPPVI